MKKIALATVIVIAIAWLIAVYRDEMSKELLFVACAIVLLYVMFVFVGIMVFLGDLLKRMGVLKDKEPTYTHVEPMTYEEWNRMSGADKVAGEWEEEDENEEE